MEQTKHLRPPEPVVPEDKTLLLDGMECGGKRSATPLCLAVNCGGEQSAASRSPAVACGGSAANQSAAAGGALHILPRSPAEGRSGSAANQERSGSVANQSAAVGGALHTLPWPHAPVHRLSEWGTYFVTAGTYRKLHHFRGPERLDELHSGLLEVAQGFGWRLEAWAVFSNHYHFVGHSPDREGGAENLSRMLGRLHEKTAKWVNGLDNVRGRHVWHNFWETRLTYERSYLARLHYTHQNAVKHGLVSAASEYPWCSAAWFELTAPSAQVRTVYSFRIDALRVSDDYDVAPA